MEKYLVTAALCISKNAFKLTRTANVMTKKFASELDTTRFVRQDDLALFFSNRSIYKINMLLKICNCRYFLAYSSCQHMHRSLELYDIQDASNKFVFRQKKGAKPKNLKSINSNSHFSHSALVISQLIQLNTHFNAYHFFLYVNQSKDMISNGQYNYLPLVRQVYKKNFDWVTHFDLIPDSIPVSPGLALAPSPYLFNLSATNVETDDDSKEFQSQLHSTLQSLAPVKKASKKTKPLVLSRQDVLSQIISGDAEELSENKKRPWSSSKS